MQNELMNEGNPQFNIERNIISIEEENKEQYQYGLDIIRFAAMVLVVIFHGLILNTLIITIIDSLPLLLSEMMFCISYSCNGLFMMLTGYLKKNKKPSLSYYAKLPQFLVEYGICYIVCGLFHIYYLKEELTIKQVINGIFTFGDVTHVWFVKMYIGLFLFSPFLNILYINIRTEKEKYLFITVLITVYSLPYSYTNFGWRWYEDGYCVMYYFIGCFIREYQPSFNRFYCICFIIIIAIIQSLVPIYNPKVTVHNFYNIGCVITTTLLFILFYKLKVKKMNNFCKFFRKITDCSFSFFLLNHIFEMIFYYHIFPEKGYDTFMKRLPHIIYVIPIISIAGIVCSLITHTITLYIIKLGFYVLDNIKRCLKGNNNIYNPS